MIEAWSALIIVNNKQKLSSDDNSHIDQQLVCVWNIGFFPMIFTKMTVGQPPQRTEERPFKGH